MVEMPTPASSLNQVVRGNVYEVGGKVIGICSASEEVGRAIYASCMERVIAWVEETCSTFLEIGKSGEVVGRVGVVQTQRPLHQILEVVWFCQTLEGQGEAVKVVGKQACWKSLNRCCVSPLPLASAHPRR